MVFEKLFLLKNVIDARFWAVVKITFSHGVLQRPDQSASKIVQDVSQKEIAEYLKIDPTHLSRIRKEFRIQ